MRKREPGKKAASIKPRKKRVRRAPTKLPKFAKLEHVDNAWNIGMVYSFVTPVSF
jgi:hypothetical protein